TRRAAMLRRARPRWRHSQRAGGGSEGMSASLIGRLGSSSFRLSTTSVSMSLTGSRFSSVLKNLGAALQADGETRSAFATALVASVADPKADGIFPPGLGSCRSNTRAGARIGSISKQGDRYLRSLFTAGALAVIRYVRIQLLFVRFRGDCVAKLFCP